MELGEKAFHKQPTVFVGRKKPLGRRHGRGLRFVRNVGLGFKTPAAAIEGTYVDQKDPFVGGVSIRGRILKGVVVSTKQNRTVVVRRNYLAFVKKYKRYEKRHTNISAHCSPCFRVNEGDIVVLGECRPLAKTVSFNVLKIEKSTEEKQSKGFRAF
eukprot:CAMPEP_0117039182 /NCGR_PEP_ID=MMETSP0472-20121206/27524_1 /TAXON_ID=693140 ORGANISM="Tiarina fusus, Strain LIS" /NCGR_SAMPLE_ID=MMETSP0472 /ASSEMBLY_ACC=CAM_ASM_000603 /LENGTH=155 /DNA_ID=CAMNT_0004749619 /DNA_START=13 /DNA_END=480 /DNA_ORIENTATION=-